MSSCAPITRAAVTVPLLGLLLGGSPAAAGERPGFWDDDSEKYLIKLTGEQVPGGGDPDARGAGFLRLDPKAETVCLAVGWKAVDGAVTAMHIHKGAAGKTGGHHIELLNDEHLAGKHNGFHSCVQVPEHDGHSGREAIQAVIDSPEGFYLNIHSTKYDKGALRGQLED